MGNSLDNLDFEEIFGISSIIPLEKKEDLEDPFNNHLKDEKDMVRIDTIDNYLETISEDDLFSLSEHLREVKEHGFDNLNDSNDFSDGGCWDKAAWYSHFHNGLDSWGIYIRWKYIVKSAGYLVHFSNRDDLDFNDISTTKLYLNAGFWIYFFHELFHH